jgi:hypothetical protein
VGSMFQSWLAPIADGLRGTNNETLNAVVFFFFRLNSDVVNVLETLRRGSGSHGVE